MRLTDLRAEAAPEHPADHILEAAGEEIGTPSEGKWSEWRLLDWLELVVGRLNALPPVERERCRPAVVGALEAAKWTVDVGWLRGSGEAYLYLYVETTCGFEAFAGPGS